MIHLIGLNAQTVATVVVVLEIKSKSLVCCRPLKDGGEGIDVSSFDFNSVAGLRETP